MAKTLIITWRDENYGSWSGSGAAFRLYDTAELSDAAVDRLHSRIRASHFTFDHGRCSWIAWDAGNARELVARLERQGWSVEHGGCWPDGPPAL